MRGVLLDVSGGGARVRTPENRLRKGSEIALSLHPNSDSTLRVSGTVVRVSDNGRVVHVSFDNIKQSKQDQLYQLVLDKERRGQRQ
jgi:c-di-GMP-binding flagellar brake protein YcgR